MGTIKAQRDAAEKQLGIEQVHQEAQSAKKELDEVLTRLAEVRDRKRDLESQLADQEVTIIQSVWQANSDLAQGRLDKLVKNELVQAVQMRLCRNDLSTVSSEIEGLEYDRAVIETTIKVTTARMIQLGGYLNLLAALINKEI